MRVSGDLQAVGFKKSDVITIHTALAFNSSCC